MTESKPSSAKQPSTQAPAVGPKLRAARARAKLTLEDLSGTSGVSRSMLSQIERGQANPTFATLWQLTQALGLDLSDLAGERLHQVKTDDHIEVMQPHFTPQIQSEDGGCTLQILSPTDMLGVFEWYDISIEPGGALSSDAHAHGVVEHLTALEGEFSVESGTAHVIVETGATARYSADRAHVIKNGGKKKARGILIVKG